MATMSERVVMLCEKHWEAHQRNCSGFVKAVAEELQVKLTGQANEIVDRIQLAPWSVLASGVQAAAQAALGRLVIGGLKAKPHGHIVVVVPGPISHGKYPTAYWGTLGGVGRRNMTVNWSWSKNDRDRVVYCALSLSS